VRRGRGFSYVDDDGGRITDDDAVARIRELAIPPAWADVWICADPLGHLQATGIDDAGRKQYLYHERWREHRDREKFERMLALGETLPRLRTQIAKDLERDRVDEPRVLACAVRLLDVGLFRIGGEEYAEHGGGLGLATLDKRHVTLRDDDTMVFDYPAKGGERRTHTVVDADTRKVVDSLRRRRGGGEQLLAYRRGRRWSPIRSEDINDYIKSHLGTEFSAKDFRTWNATVLAAVVLAGAGAADGDGAKSKGARKRVVDGAVRQVAEMLGNTPAVARRAYIDPRVTDRYVSGTTIEVGRRGPARGDRARRRVERAVIGLLKDAG
jgi:DNA topoisomerase IB